MLDIPVFSRSGDFLLHSGAEAFVSLFIGAGFNLLGDAGRRQAVYGVYRDNRCAGRQVAGRAARCFCLKVKPQFIILHQ